MSATTYKVSFNGGVRRPFFAELPFTDPESGLCAYGVPHIHGLQPDRKQDEVWEVSVAFRRRSAFDGHPCYVLRLLRKCEEATVLLPWIEGYGPSVSVASDLIPALQDRLSRWKTKVQGRMIIFYHAGRESAPVQTLEADTTYVMLATPCLRTRDPRVESEGLEFCQQKYVVSYDWESRNCDAKHYYFIFAKVVGETWSCTVSDEDQYATVTWHFEGTRTSFETPTKKKAIKPKL